MIYFNIYYRFNLYFVEINFHKCNHLIIDLPITIFIFSKLFPHILKRLIPKKHILEIK
jgi:hypothetical protein